MKRLTVTTLLALLLSSTLSAQQPAGLPTAGERQAAHIASWVTVLSAEALDIWSSIRSDNPKRSLIMNGLRVGAVEGSVSILKALIPDARPCAPTHTCSPDDEQKGFPSGHAALACSTFGGPSLSLTIPLAGGTALGRSLAGRHFWRQLGAGCALGAVLGTVIR